jgi:hypothetical protein
MFNRIKNILVAPKSEWPVIAGENRSHVTVLTSWVLILALIPAIASFIGYGLIGQTVMGIKIGGTIGFGIRQAITQYVNIVLAIYLVSLVVYLLAGSFGAKKDFDKAFSLAAYAYTPIMIGGIFYIFPVLSFLTFVCSVYTLVLLYMGLKPMMQVPGEKQTAYFIVTLLAMIVATAVLSLVLAPIILGSGAAAAALAA